MSEKYSFTSDFDYSDTVAGSYDPESVTTEEKLEYGYLQEPSLTGNIVRYGEALYNSTINNDIDFSTALSNIENERQRDIFRQMPQMFGLQEKDEDAAVIAGRVGAAVADPVTWAIPWTKAYKLGGLGVTALGAGVTGTETAARDYLLYGEVNPYSAGISALTGGTATALSYGLRNKALDKGEEVLSEITSDSKEAQRVASDNLEEIVTQTSDEAFEETTNVVASPSMREVIRKYQRQNWYGIPEPVELTRATNQRDFIKAHQRFQMGLQQPLTVKETVSVQKAAEKVINPSEVNRLVNEKPVLSLNTQPIQDLKKAISVLSGRMRGATKADRDRIEIEIEQLNVKLLNAQKNYFNSQVDSQLTKADMHGSILEELSSKGELTDSIMAKILHEGTRPAVGGLGGFAASGIVGDEDDDALTIGLIVAGAMAGQYNKILRKSNLTEIEKETGRLIVNQAAGANLRTNVNILSAGTIATKLNSMGGYAKVIGNMLFTRPGAITDSVESRYLRETRKFYAGLHQKIGDSYDDLNIKKLSGQMLNRFDLDQIKVGYKGIDGSLNPITQVEIDAARRMVPILEKERDSLAKSVKDVGIKFKDLGENYGMPQIINFDNVRKNEDDFFKTVLQAMRLEHPKLKEKAILKKTEEYFDDVLGTEKYAGRPRYTADTVFNDKGFRPLLDNFEKQRHIKSFEGRKLLASKGYFNQDAGEAFYVYGDRNIKGREFARSFGAKGEFLEYAFKQIDDSFAGTVGAKGKFGNDYRKYILETVDAFWGVHGSDQAGTVGANALSVLTTLANTTMLTRVSISSLGDMLQPFQNSGFGAATRSILGKIKKKPSFAEKGGFKYDKSFEREFSALMAHGVDPTSKLQARMHDFNKKFFKVVQLDRVTRAARSFAYDTGIYRAFAISRKTKFSSSLNKEMETMGLSKADIDVLKKYKTAEEAFDADDARSILDRAGQRVSDRDAIIPQVGNRMLFSQHRNPYIRSLGQFLSWAQGKTAQVNSLVERVESGDAALAIRTLGLTSIYGAVQAFREFSKPSFDGDKLEIDDPRSAAQFAKETMEFSSNYMPWHINKAVRLFASPFNENLLPNISPTTGLVENMWDGFGRIGSNIAEGDIEGAAASAIKMAPGGREFLGYGERLDLPVPEDRRSRAKGGTVDVPRAASEPDERVDKMTGMPYDQQAGTAFVDEEDPLRRLGFGHGGKVLNALRRTSV